jgi:hypothetical protein
MCLNTQVLGGERGGRGIKVYIWGCCCRPLAHMFPPPLHPTVTVYSSASHAVRLVTAPIKRRCAAVGVCTNTLYSVQWTLYGGVHCVQCTVYTNYLDSVCCIVVVLYSSCTVNYKVLQCYRRKKSNFYIFLLVGAVGTQCMKRVEW